MATYTGTRKNDKLWGTNWSDVFTGGLGDDFFDGAGGFDTAIYQGSFWDYNIVLAGTADRKVTVYDRIAYRDGFDTLINVEALKFGDVTIRLDKNNAAITRADYATTNEDTPVVINVLGNDKDFERDALHISAINNQAISVGQTVSLGNGASVTLNADQTLTYNPGSAFQSLKGGALANQSFTYVVADSKGALSTPTAVDVAVKGLWEKPLYIVDGTVNEAGQKPDTNEIMNSIGVTADHFGLVRAPDAGIELGLQVTYRNGPPVLATDANGYGDGVLRFQVNEGPQLMTNGSPSDRYDRAGWSFEFSVITGLNGETTNLDSFKFKLLYDVDAGVGTSYRTLVLEPGGTGTSHHQWRDVTNNCNNVVIAGDEGNAYVTQNGENYAFDFFQQYLNGAYGPNLSNPRDSFQGPANFDIILQAYDKANTLIAQNHINVAVVDQPDAYSIL